MAIKKSSNSGIPFGNTAGRPTTATGQPYFNGEIGRLELYTSTGWENIVQEVPGVSGVSGNYSESANSGTIVITGTNFVSGAIVSATGTNSVEVQASSTTYNSLVQLTAVFTGLSNANEPYDIKVTNPSNLFGILPDALYVNASPVWQTSSGSLGTFTEQVSISVSATATDSDSTISYALAGGSTLPSGINLNSSTGLISGTLPNISSNTTYTFTINASDGVNTVVPRTFSITSTSRLEDNASTLAYFDFVSGRSWNATNTLLDLTSRGKNLPRSNANYSANSGGIITTANEQSIRSTGLVGSIPEISMGVWVKLDGSTNRGVIYYGDNSNNNHFFVRDGIMGSSYNFDIGKDINGADTWTPSKYNGQNVRNYITTVSDYANKYWFYVVRVNTNGVVTTSLNGSNFETTVNAVVNMSGHSSGQFGIAGDPYNDNASNHTYGGAWWYQGLITQEQVSLEWDRYKSRFGW